MRGIGQERPYSAHETHAECAEARGKDEEGAPGEGWEKPTVKPLVYDYLLSITTEYLSN